MTRQRPMDPILLVGSIILLAAIATWVLPAGRFERKTDPQTGRTVVVPGSYRSVPRSPVGPWGLLESIPQGMIEAGEVFFYVLLAGAALTVVESTGAIGNFLNRIMARFGDRPLLVLALASILFLAGGASNSMYEEILAFVPLLCALMRRLGLDHEMGLAISVGTATVAGAFSPFNTFLLGISQPMAEVPLFSAFAFRTVIFVLALGIWGGYLAWYTARYRSIPASQSHPHNDPQAASPAKSTTRDVWVLTALNAGMIGIVLGGVFLHWGLRQFSAVFVLMGFVAGLTGGLGWRGTSEQFAEGLRRLALGAA